MAILLDTNLLIEAERKDGLNTIHWPPEAGIFISAVTASELLVGVHLADSEKRRIRRAAFVEAILAQFPILDFTLEAARIHAELWAYLTTHGKMIGAHDLLIAATAITHHCQLATRNIKEFSQVPGLSVISG